MSIIPGRRNQFSVRVSFWQLIILSLLWLEAFVQLPVYYESAPRSVLPRGLLLHLWVHFEEDMCSAFLSGWPQILQLVFPWLIPGQLVVQLVTLIRKTSKYVLTLIYVFNLIPPLESVFACRVFDSHLCGPNSLKYSFLINLTFSSKVSLS